MRPRMMPAALAACLWPGIAAAHSLSPGASGFQAGALSLLTGPTDALGWLALAVFAGLHATRRAGFSPELFAGGLLAGFAVARIGALPPPGWAVDLAPLALFGALLAAGRRLPAPPLLALAGAAGAIRGWHDGADALGRADGWALAAGLALTGYVVVTCASAATAWFLQDRAGWRLIAVRAAGSWITAIAIMVGGFAWRQ